MRDKSVNILFLTKYESLGASTRYRSQIHFDPLDKNGFKVIQKFLFSDQFLKRRYSGEQFPISSLLQAFFKRLRDLRHIFHADLVVIEYEIFPFFPPVFEILFRLLGKKLIFDFDDAIFHRYDRHPNFLVKLFLSNKFVAIAKCASGISCGNSYLADYFLKNNCDRVEVIPTGISCSKFFRVGKKGPKSKIAIGWVGSPATQKYLAVIKDPLQRIITDYNCEIVLIGANNECLEDLPVTRIDWSSESEDFLLSNLDIGIMPLIDDPWSKGKCGFKLIQYFAKGVPAVASWVGVNSDIIIHGKTGYLARNNEEWYQYLSDLIMRSHIREEFGEAGFDFVRQAYSSEIISMKYCRFLKESA